jgi:hypothetical protein
MDLGIDPTEEVPGDGSYAASHGGRRKGAAAAATSVGNLTRNGRPVSVTGLTPSLSSIQLHHSDISPSLLGLTPFPAKFINTPNSKTSTCYFCPLSSIFVWFRGSLHVAYFVTCNAGLAFGNSHRTGMTPGGDQALMDLECYPMSGIKSSAGGSSLAGSHFPGYGGQSLHQNGDFKNVFSPRYSDCTSVNTAAATVGTAGSSSSSASASSLSSTAVALAAVIASGQQPGTGTGTGTAAPVGAGIATRTSDFTAGNTMFLHYNAQYDPSSALAQHDYDENGHLRRDAGSSDTHERFVDADRLGGGPVSPPANGSRHLGALNVLADSCIASAEKDRRHRVYVLQQQQQQQKQQLQKSMSISSSYSASNGGAGGMEMDPEAADATTATAAGVRTIYASQEHDGDADCGGDIGGTIGKLYPAADGAGELSGINPSDDSVDTMRDTSMADVSFTAMADLLSPNHSVAQLDGQQAPLLSPIIDAKSPDFPYTPYLALLNLETSSQSGGSNGPSQRRAGMAHSTSSSAVSGHGHARGTRSAAAAVAAASSSSSSSSSVPESGVRSRSSARQSARHALSAASTASSTGSTGSSSHMSRVSDSGAERLVLNLCTSSAVKSVDRTASAAAAATDGRPPLPLGGTHLASSFVEPGSTSNSNLNRSLFGTSSKRKRHSLHTDSDDPLAEADSSTTHVYAHNHHLLRYTPFSF